jgi:hypothetical protein
LGWGGVAAGPLGQVGLRPEREKEREGEMGCAQGEEERVFSLFSGFFLFLVLFLQFKFKIESV